MTLRDSILTQIGHLRRMRTAGKLSHNQVTFMDKVCVWRHKDNSVTILPTDGSYRRTINPSWYERD